MLKIEDLSYRYLSRHKFTLKKINLQLAEGEMLLLSGRSGFGKSTLIKAINGLLMVKILHILHRKRLALWLVPCTNLLMTSFLL